MRTASTIPVLLLVAAIGAAGCGPKLSEAQRFTLTVTLSATNVNLSELVLSMEYKQGELCGTGSAVQCSTISLDSGAFDDKEDSDSNGSFILDATLDQSGNGMAANRNVFLCSFSSFITPANDNFIFTVTSALDDSGTKLTSTDLDAIALTVLSSPGEPGSCQAGSTTTTTPSSTTSSSTTSSSTTPSSTTSSSTTSSSTTSTVSSSTTTVTTGPTTTTMPTTAGFTFDVTYEFTFPLTTVGALQFDSDYSAAGGDFDGSGAAVACAKQAGFTALEAFNDKDATTKVLSQGFIDNSGFAGPRTVSTCRFLDTDGIAPKPSDFVNTTTDCTDLNSMAVTCFVGVKSVTACSCGDGTVNCVSETCDSGPASATQTCGDGVVNCSDCTTEQCDDGNNVNDGNGCTGDCHDDHLCGNKLVETIFEQCDDGGTCQAGSNPGTPCTLPAGSECTGGFCQTQSGDGCDSNCMLEP